MGHDARGDALHAERPLAKAPGEQEGIRVVIPPATSDAILFPYQFALLELARTEFPNLTAALRTLTETAARTLGVSRVSIWQVGEDQGLACADLFVQASGAHEQSAPLPAAAAAPYLHVLGESRVLAVADARADPRLAVFRAGSGRLGTVAPTMGVVGRLDAPVRQQGRLAGVVCHEQIGAPRAWSDADREFAASVAELVSTAWEAEDRRRAERALQESETRFRQLFECSPDAIFVEDTAGRVLLANAAAARLHGIDGADLVGRQVLDLVTADCRERVIREFPRLVSGELDGLQSASLGPDGRSIPVELKVTRLEYGGRPSLLLHVRNISRRRQAEDRLHDSEERLRRLIEQMPALLWTVDADLRFTSSLGGGLVTLGLQPNEVVGQSLFEFFRTPDPDAWPIAAHRRALQGESVSFETGWAGQVYQCHVEPLRAAGGEQVGAVGVALDITASRRAQDELQRREAQLATAQRLAHIGSWEWDCAHDVLRWSDELYRIHGLEPGTVTPTFAFFLEQVHPEDRERVRAALARARAGAGRFAFTERIVRADGSLRHLLSQGELVSDAAGNLTRLVGFCQDITERQEADERLRASREQLQALAGQLQRVRDEESVRIAREIHDELGQSLTGLKIDLSWLETHWREGGHEADALATGEKMRAMRRVVDTTLQAVRRICSELRPAVLDALGLVAAIEWQTHEFQQRTSTRCRVSLPRRPVAVDSTRATAMYRIYQEILTNVARHAHARRLAVRLRVSPAAELVLEVRDNGRGISPADIASSRSLGLMGMRERAALVGGQVEFTGTPGRGTTVRVTLPGAAVRRTRAVAAGARQAR